MPVISANARHHGSSWLIAWANLIMAMAVYASQSLQSVNPMYALDPFMNSTPQYGAPSRSMLLPIGRQSRLCSSVPTIPRSAISHQLLSLAVLLNVAVFAQQRRLMPCIVLAVKHPQVRMRCKEGCVDVVSATAPQHSQRLHAVKRQQPPAVPITCQHCSSLRCCYTKA